MGGEGMGEAVGWNLHRMVQDIEQSGTELSKRGISSTLSLYGCDFCIYIESKLQCFAQSLYRLGTLTHKVCVL